MRRFHVNVAGQDEPIVVSVLSDDGIHATVLIGEGEEARELTLSVDQLEQGRFLVRRDEAVDRVDLVATRTGWLALDGWDEAKLTVLEERDTWLGAGGAADGEGTVTVAMPGKVVKVDVTPGEAVTRGQRLLVIEAMKMENDVKSPRDGVVSLVNVNEGDAVEAGQSLVELE